MCVSKVHPDKQQRCAGRDSFSPGLGGGLTVQVRPQSKAPYKRFDGVLFGLAVRLLPHCQPPSPPPPPGWQASRAPPRQGLLQVEALWEELESVVRGGGGGDTLGSLSIAACSPARRSPPSWRRLIGPGWTGEKVLSTMDPLSYAPSPLAHPPAQSRPSGHPCQPREGGGGGGGGQEGAAGRRAAAARATSPPPPAFHTTCQPASRAPCEWGASF